ncbi:predicted protein [Histoplasma capsulatum var. duboisii H88]|uniref:Predicted protein n=1 Tax=Ajellomyces capsulatus (strain H88) TaxID=544711 RepID=F0UMK9_AJEC8|nr:predicted protein [Histoplasma capsulatum var. duboisii H88]
MEHLFSDLETRTMKAKMMDPLNVVISPNYTRNSSGNREYEPEREGYASILSGRLDGRARKGQKGMYLLIQLIIQKFGHFKYWQILASPHFSFDFKELYIITVVRLHQSTRAHAEDQVLVNNKNMPNEAMQARYSTFVWTGSTFLRYSITVRRSTYADNERWKEPKRRERSAHIPDGADHDSTVEASLGLQGLLHLDPCTK